MPRSEAGCAEGGHVFLANKLLLWHLGGKNRDTKTQRHTYTDTHAHI